MEEEVSVEADDAEPAHMFLLRKMHVSEQQRVFAKENIRF